MGLLERLEKQKNSKKVEEVEVEVVKRQHFYDEFKELKQKIHQEVIDLANANMTDFGHDQSEGTQEELLHMVEELVDREAPNLPRSEKQRISKEIFDEVAGLGPLESLLANSEVTEIMVNGPYQIYIEKKGKIQLADVCFRDNQHVMNIIDRIVSSIGRRIDESSPMVDARLADGSRVNAIIPPLSLVGPVITIRKFSKTPISIHDLIRFGSVTPRMVGFLEACVKGKLNIVVSGGTGSGKTTLLNVLSSFIPDDERIVTIEDAAELQLRQQHVITLETRPPNLEGKGQITIRDLVRNSLRMRPDRIIVGEVRSAETLDMLQAMNTGHDGSLTTAHANTPRDMISRLETMVLMAGMDLPIKAIRDQITSAVDLVVQQARMRDGTRKIINITEVVGMEGDVVSLQDVYRFESEGMDVNGKIKGHFVATGIKPNFLEKLRGNGINIKDEWFVN